MTTLKLVVEYDGSRFNGFQRQTSSSALRAPKRPRYDEEGRKRGLPCTVQDVLEDACVNFQPGATLESLRLRFAGRTDKGVHARGQVVAVNFQKELQEENWEIVRALNSRLPRDVTVRSAERCSPTLEPRKVCTNKLYSYTVKFRRLVRDGNGDPLPVCKGGPHSIRSAHDSACLWVVPWSLDDHLLPGLCKQLEGEHDYGAFVHKEDRHTRNNVMKLSRFDYAVLEETNEYVPIVNARFHLQAGGFGRTMIRNLVGFVVDLSRGKVDAKHVADIWSPENANLVCAAPASGLCLEKVWL